MATNADGTVRRGSRFGVVSPPGVWGGFAAAAFSARTKAAVALSAAGAAYGISATMVRPSPFAPELVLVALADASLVLLRREDTEPLAHWPSPTGAPAVLALEWSMARPAVFFVLEASSGGAGSVLHAFDMLASDTGVAMSHDVGIAAVSMTTCNDVMVLACCGSQTRGDTVRRLALAPWLTSCKRDELSRLRALVDRML